MSAELHKLRYKIRERKRTLRLQIKLLKIHLAKEQKRFVRHMAGRAEMKPEEISFLRECQERLGRRRAALRELVDVTRK